MSYFDAGRDAAGDTTLDSSFDRLHDPVVQSLLESLDAEPLPARIPVPSPFSNSLTPPLTPLSPQLAPTPEMLQSVREAGLPLRRHSVIMEASNTTATSPGGDESYPSPRGVAYAHPPTTPTPVSEPSPQLPNYTWMRGVLVYLPMNWPANYAGQPAVVDTIQSKHTTLRLLNRPLEKLVMQPPDLLNLTVIAPNPGDFVKMIGGQWAGCKGRLVSANLVTGYDVELTNGQHVAISAGHLAKYYGRGYLTVGPGSFPSSSSTSPSCSSQFPGYSTAYHSQTPHHHHHHQLHTPPPPSPSTPTGSYSTSRPSSFNFVTSSNPQQSMCGMPYQCGLFQYPSRTSAPPQYTCSQSSTHMPFMRGMMEIKKQVTAGSCRPPQSSTKQQQRQKIVNSVDKLLEALVKRASPASLNCTTTPDVHSSEVVTSSMKVSTLCPITKQRMQYPCRGQSCKHLQCFDAKPFLELAFKRAFVHKSRPSANLTNSWKCPVCSKVIHPQNLYIDKSLMKIIADCKATELEHKGNNQWEPIEKHEKHKTSDVIDLTCDSDDEDTTDDDDDQDTTDDE